MYVFTIHMVKGHLLMFECLDAREISQNNNPSPFSWFETLESLDNNQSSEFGYRNRSTFTVETVPLCLTKSAFLSTAAESVPPAITNRRHLTQSNSACAQTAW